MARSKKTNSQEEASAPVEGSVEAPVITDEAPVIADEAPVIAAPQKYEVVIPGQGLLPVGVNGKIKTLKRGVPLSVNPEVYNVLRDSGLIP